MCRTEYSELSENQQEILKKYANSVIDHIVCLGSCNRYFAVSKQLRQYEELEIEVKQLIGMDFKCLKVLLAQGWTLNPPKRNDDKLAEMAELAI